jgi:hypothetical protein
VSSFNVKGRFQYFTLEVVADLQPTKSEIYYSRSMHDELRIH